MRCHGCAANGEGTALGFVINYGYPEKTIHTMLDTDSIDLSKPCWKRKISSVYDMEFQGLDVPPGAELTPVQLDIYGEYPWLKALPGRTRPPTK